MNATTVQPTTTMPVTDTLRVRAAVNRWISENFPQQRRFLGSTIPIAHDDEWRVALLARHGKDRLELGKLVVIGERPNLVNDTPQTIKKKLSVYLRRNKSNPPIQHEPCVGEFHDFRHDDGISASASLPDRSVELLLTDPPYGISKTYVCEGQVPRRLRKNGTDFIMPRGHFGEWDDEFPSPAEWAVSVLSKITGWAVIFCAQAQIGDYTAILKEDGFVAVGTLVWQKTNPVPFNHKFKPINAWEAAVVGKRPGTKFNGRNVHNVFAHKSPSPQHRIHPTQKPLPLISELVSLFSNEGDTILDPFAGSATTVVAGMALRRKVLAFETDPDAFEAATARILNSKIQGKLL